MVNRENVTVKLEDAPVSYGEGNGDEEMEVGLVDMIERLQACLESVPREYRDSAKVRIWASGDYASAYVEVNYTRPETDEEIAAKEEREKRYQLERERREREEFERLKKKYANERMVD